MNELQQIQKKIDFIAREIREHRIELHRLHKELQSAIDKQQKMKE
jgi:cell division protein ZapA (FtsZ GTPase activity inhibitor)